MASWIAKATATADGAFADGSAARPTKLGDNETTARQRKRVGRDMGCILADVRRRQGREPNGIGPARHGGGTIGRVA
jgi:hypothetical protein